MMNKNFMKSLNVHAPQYYIVTSSKYNNLDRISKSVYKYNGIVFRSHPPKFLEIKRTPYSEFERDGPFSKELYTLIGDKNIYNRLVAKYGY